jgi:hypothetical protein
MTLDASGRLGVGLTDPQSPIEAQSDSGGTGIRIRGRASANAGTLRFFANNGTTQQAKFEANDTTVEVGSITNVPLLLLSNSTERARLTAGGDLLVGTTTAGGQGGLTVYPNGSATSVQLSWKRAAGATASNGAVFFTDATVVGTISYNDTATAYNTSSDRRLKENIAPADDSGAVIDAIQIVKHDWKSGGHTRFGVIAQDLNAVAPEAVKMGDDGQEVTDTWGVDYSKLVPMLVKEVQSLRKRVAELEAK